MENSHVPLADRIRPDNLSEFVGQKHLVGENGILKKLIEKDQLVSFIFWGPPGCGKTTLARIIAKKTKSHFVHFSAVTTTLDDVRRIVKESKTCPYENKQLPLGNSTSEEINSHQKSQRTILFIDEIHRFNKAQQDAFLPHVEDGTITLIGATTENPSFEVIGPLLSRCRVLVLEQLNHEELGIICERGLKELKRKITDDAKNYLVESANGDSRNVLNILEIADKLSPKKKILTLKLIEEAMQKKSLMYDRLGEEHYNTISAYIKSLRASNVDSALYYLARMIEAGEDPLFIARRMVIFASEDIGMAQPTALVVANEVFQACDQIGYPECAINLAHGTVYLAKAPKNRSACDSYFRAVGDVRKHGNLPIPLILRNAPTTLMKNLGYGKGYTPYPEPDASLLPDKLKGRKYYR